MASITSSALTAASIQNHRPTNNIGLPGQASFPRPRRGRRVIRGRRWTVSGHRMSFTSTASITFTTPYRHSAPITRRSVWQRTRRSIPMTPTISGPIKARSFSPPRPTTTTVLIPASPLIPPATYGCHLVHTGMALTLFSLMLPPVCSMPRTPRSLASLLTSPRAIQSKRRISTTMGVTIICSSIGARAAPA